MTSTVKQANIFSSHPSLCISCGKDIRTLGGGVWQGQGQFKCWPCSGRTPHDRQKDTI